MPSGRAVDHGWIGPERARPPRGRGSGLARPSCAARRLDAARERRLGGGAGYGVSGGFPYPPLPETGGRAPRPRRGSAPGPRSSNAGGAGLSCRGDPRRRERPHRRTDRGRQAGAADRAGVRPLPGCPAGVCGGAPTRGEAESRTVASPGWPSPRLCSPRRASPYRQVPGRGGEQARWAGSRPAGKGRGGRPAGRGGEQARRRRHNPLDTPGAPVPQSSGRARARGPGRGPAPVGVVRCRTAPRPPWGRWPVPRPDGPAGTARPPRWPGRPPRSGGGRPRGCRRGRSRPCPASTSPARPTG